MNLDTTIQNHMPTQSTMHTTLMKLINMPNQFLTSNLKEFSMLDKRSTSELILSPTLTTTPTVKITTMEFFPCNYNKVLYGQ